MPNYSPSQVHQPMTRQSPLTLAYQSGCDFKAWQRKLRKKVNALTGLDRLMKRDWPALKPKTLWQRENELGTIEKIVITSESGADMPMYWCIPKGVDQPRGVFICLQGHSSGAHNSVALDFETNSRPIEVNGDRDFGINAMRYGYAALCLEQRSFGERREQKLASVSQYNGCHDAAMHALMLGHTLLAERIYDVDRALDYLGQRGDIDMKRVGVMGNSGGGTVSLFAAALLPRVCFAMPSCYFCTFADSIMSLYHCGCNFVPGLMEVCEMSDIAALACPKPMVMVAGKEDDIFPIKATRQAFKTLQAIYAEQGVADRVALKVGPEGHRFYADLAWPAMGKMLAE